MKYEKPKMTLTQFEHSKNLASLTDWLGRNGFEATAEDYITTYVANS